MLSVLSAQFAAEDRDALDEARDMRHWAELRAMLHRWRLRAVACVRSPACGRLRAVACADPEFWAAAREARDDAQPGDLPPVPGQADSQ